MWFVENSPPKSSQIPDINVNTPTKSSEKSWLHYSSSDEEGQDEPLMPCKLEEFNYIEIIINMILGNIKQTICK